MTHSRILSIILTCALSVPCVAQKARPELNAPGTLEKLGSTTSMLAGAIGAPTGLVVTESSGVVQARWLAPQAPLSVAVIEEEPNGRLDEAQRLLGPLPVVSGNAEVSDEGQLSVTFADDSIDDFEDLFTVVTSSSGGRIVLDDLTEDCDLYLLSDASGTLEIVGESLNLATDAEIISLTDMAPGTYLVGISIFDPGQPGRTSGYTLSIEAEVAAEQITGYRLYRSASPSAAQSGTLAAEVGPVLTATDTPPLSATAFYQVTAMGEVSESGPSNEVEIAVSTATETEAPSQVDLSENWPNPFRSSTLIPFELKVAGPVRLEIFDTQGRLISVLVNGTLVAGRHRLEWSPVNVPAGAYVYRLTTDTTRITRLMTYLR